MTENTKAGMIAINKFFFYAMNFGAKEMEVATFNGIEKKFLPEFFEAFPLSLRQHLYEKWEYGYEKYGSRGVMMYLFGELSQTHRKELMGWILDNYNDEQKLNFNEEED